MHVGILSYPMLFQRDGQVQQQVRATIHALKQLREQAGQPLMVSLIAPNHCRMADYDLIHVFSATHGNVRFVEEAAEQGVPVVLTPLIAAGWSQATGRDARTGAPGLDSRSGWNVQTAYAQTRRALQLASLVVALGEAEEQAIAAGFLVPQAKLRVFPNGISAHYFAASAELFRLRTGISGPFALMAGAMPPCAEPTAIAQTLGALGLPLVLAGEARQRDQADLRALRELRAAPGVTCLGGLTQDSAMLASAYAAAAVLLLPGAVARSAQQAREALACGTPVLMTAHTALCVPGSDGALARVRWDDSEAQQRAIARLLGGGAAAVAGQASVALACGAARERVRALVRGYAWPRLAQRIGACYAQVLEARRRIEHDLHIAQAFLAR